MRGARRRRPPCREGAGRPTSTWRRSSRAQRPVRQARGPADRTTLARQIQAIDANSTIEFVDYPPQVKSGENFNITRARDRVVLAPWLAVALVDRAHRWYARPASSAGWGVVGAPTDHRSRRQAPERMARPTARNSMGRRHHLREHHRRPLRTQTTGQWGESKVIYTLRAPARPGDYSIVGAYLLRHRKSHGARLDRAPGLRQAAARRLRGQVRPGEVHRTARDHRQVSAPRDGRGVRAAVTSGLLLALAARQCRVRSACVSTTSPKSTRPRSRGPSGRGKRQPRSPHRSRLAERRSGRRRRTASAPRSTDPANWLSHGRGYAEQRFSPLSQIHANNVSRLRLAWTFDTGLRRGHEATPLVVDGVMFVTGSWSVVFALDAATRPAVLWTYDPEISEEVGRKACCDVVNRGVAVYRGRVFRGRSRRSPDCSRRLDGRAPVGDRDGRPEPALHDHRRAARRRRQGSSSATVAPSSACAATSRPTTAEERQNSFGGATRFPGDPSEPFESKALEEAASTWNGEYWKLGGGGTAWDSMAYDPDLGLLYVGTGNGSPWRAELRSPGGGDNLFLSSILALDPGDGRDPLALPDDACRQLGLHRHPAHDPGRPAEIDGVLRKVIMQAPKNGFFYVLDRETGEFISAEAYVTRELGGRRGSRDGPPDPEPERRLRGGPRAGDAHVSRRPQLAADVVQSRQTGLVYIPAQEMAGPYLLAGIRSGSCVAGSSTPASTPPSARSSTARSSPGTCSPGIRSSRSEAWRHPHGMPWNGGTLTTAGNLVFRGRPMGASWPCVPMMGTCCGRVTRRARASVLRRSPTRVGGVQYVAVRGRLGRRLRPGGRRRAPRQQASNPRGRVVAYALVDEAITPDAVEGHDGRAGSRRRSPRRRPLPQLVLALSRRERHRRRRESRISARALRRSRRRLRSDRREWTRGHLDARLLQQWLSDDGHPCDASVPDRPGCRLGSCAARQSNCALRGLALFRELAGSQPAQVIVEVGFHLCR